MKKGSEESIMPPLLLALMDYTCVLLGLVSWFPCFFVSFSQDNLDRIKKKKEQTKTKKTNLSFQIRLSFYVVLKI